MNNETVPLGEPVVNWTPPPRPAREVLAGRTCRLEPLDAAAHADALFEANAADADGRVWAYMAYGPFATREQYRAWVEKVSRTDDPLFVAIVDTAASRPVGVAAYQRLDTTHGVIEIGHLVYSPALQRTTAATEAMYLMIRRVFELGYRRCEWKCNALNAKSRRAAERLGFAYEGTFRQAVVVKGRNRDSDWLSIIDREWPARRAEFERWLAPENFDEQGRQRTPLRMPRG